MLLLQLQSYLNWFIKTIILKIVSSEFFFRKADLLNGKRHYLNGALVKRFTAVRKMSKNLVYLYNIGLDSIRCNNKINEFNSTSQRHLPRNN